MDGGTGPAILDPSESERAATSRISREINRSPSPAEDVASSLHGTLEHFVSSTPVAGGGGHVRPRTLADLSPCVPRTPQDSLTDRNNDFITSLASTQSETDTPETLKAPILGYEVMDHRAKFTVFRIQICKGPHESWFLFRRYSDFVRLNSKLKELCPNFRLSLPSKKWFGNNFDPNFLEDRMLGLQAFVNNIIGHRDLCLSEPVREFFCLDDPPGPHDSLEESRALCESLEDENFKLKQELLEREEKLSLLEEEMGLYKAEIENLKKALRVERSTGRHCSPSSQPSECSLPEHEQLTSEIIAQHELKTNERLGNQTEEPQKIQPVNGVGSHGASCEKGSKGHTKNADRNPSKKIASQGLQPIDSMFTSVDLSS